MSNILMCGTDPVGQVCDIPATDISYDNTTSGITADDVQSAIDEINMLSGGEVNGSFGVHFQSTTTEQAPDTWLQLGNEIPTGQVGNSVGKISIFGNGSKAVILQAADNMTTANRIFTFGDRSGEVALTTDHHYVNYYNWNQTIDIQLGSGYTDWDFNRNIIMYSCRGNSAFLAILTQHNGEYCVIQQGNAITINSWTVVSSTGSATLNITLAKGGGSSTSISFIW